MFRLLFAEYWKVLTVLPILMCPAFSDNREKILKYITIIKHFPLKFYNCLAQNKHRITSDLFINYASTYSKITNHTDYVIAGVLNDVHLQISISKCVFYTRDISYFYAVFTNPNPPKLFVLAYKCQVTVAK